MIAKYIMSDAKDYRGTVKLVRTVNGLDTAYTEVEALTDNMLLVSDEEIADHAEFLVTKTPTVITARQARAALINAGLDEAVETAIAVMDGVEGKLARNEWEYATTIERDHPMISQLQNSLGLSDEDINNLFIVGSKL